MNVTIIDNDRFDVYINSSYIDFDNHSDNKDNELYDNLKKILISVRKKYSLNIFGFYDVDIYYINSFATILRFSKKDDDSILYKNVDLKIVEHDSDNVYLKFEDFCNIKYFKKALFYNEYYYANVNDMKVESKNFSISKILEHCDVVIDDFNKISFGSTVKFSFNNCK